MNEKDILDGFITAPSNDKVARPWTNFENRVISTNRLTILYAAIDALETRYDKWPSVFQPEPFTPFMFNNLSNNKYLPVADGFYSLIEGKTPLAERVNGIDKSVITPVETNYAGNPIKFDLWQMAPIYNACIFWDKRFYMAHSRKDNCLMFKHASKDIEMAIKLLEE